MIVLRGGHWPGVVANAVIPALWKGKAVRLFEPRSSRPARAKWQNSSLEKTQNWCIYSKSLKRLINVVILREGRKRISERRI